MDEMKILIVDDDEDSVMLFKALLEDEYIIDYANDGISALKKLDSFLPDLVLLDIVMPGMNGFEVCKKINSSSKYADIPVILVTSKNEDEFVQSGFEAGAMDYIKKPFTQTEVLLRIKSVLHFRKNILQLKELNTIKDEFVSMVSHDLKNPLTMISGYCEILLDEKINVNLNTKQFGMIKEIHNSASHQLNIIKSLLNISLLESGRMKIEKKEFKISDAVKRAINELKFRIDRKKINISITLDEEIKVKGDEDRIVQVISNLTGNALKFTNDKGNIYISAEETGEGITVSVKDDGVGISQFDIEKIFNPYKVFTTFGTSGEKGTGLGLNICMRIIHAHDGKIWAESEPGKGSVFYFILPRG